MTAAKERWMLIGTFALAVFVLLCIAMPNYKSAQSDVEEATRLEDRISKLERRQIEVQQMRDEYEVLSMKVKEEYKAVPATPDTAQIVQALSMNVDGMHVLDQSFVAGSTTQKTSDDGFYVQPLAIAMEADFEAVYSVIEQAESMGRLIRVSSLRIARPESELDSTVGTLQAAVGLHAPFDPVEDR